MEIDATPPFTVRAGLAFVSQFMVVSSHSATIARYARLALLKELYYWQGFNDNRNMARTREATLLLLYILGSHINLVIFLKRSKRIES
jgi:hypothetical protein